MKNTILSFITGIALGGIPSGLVLFVARDFWTYVAIGLLVFSFTWLTLFSYANSDYYAEKRKREQEA